MVAAPASAPFAVSTAHLLQPALECRRRRGCESGQLLLNGCGGFHQLLCLLRHCAAAVV